MILSDSIRKQGEFIFRWRSYLPLLVIPLFVHGLYHSEYLERMFGDSVNDVWEAMCVGISLCGLLIRSLVAGYVPRGTSGRNTRTQVAETLNTTGMYSVVRNPLYFGNFVISLGIFLFTQVWWLIAVAVIGFYFYHERIVLMEEDFLQKKFGNVFLKWAEKTPAFWPRWRNWRTPRLPFSFKTMIRREFSTLFSIVVSFSVLSVAVDVFGEHEFEIEPFWVAFFLTGLAIYITVLFLKKRTTLLNVAGR